MAAAGETLQAAPLAQTTTQPPARLSVLIELTAAPVTQIYAASQPTNVSAAQVDITAQVAAATRTQLATIEQGQQRLLTALQGIGAQVLYRNQRVYNGIAVRLTPDKLAQVAQLPGVKAIHLLTPKYPTAQNSAPLSGAPTLWQGNNGLGITGAGRKIAIIDTGVDYLHTDFGGPGIGYSANDPTRIGDIVGFPNAKIIGGYDFAGDHYNANPDALTYQPIPSPDPDPMDCYAHGTHVAGIAAGYGVNGNGATYGGPYHTDINLGGLRIPPGVAPEAQLYALKVFGCTGSSEIVDQAIEWAVDPNGDGDLSDHVDVINLSLGSPYGSTDDPTAVASMNAVAAGVIVVASAGNSYDVTYVTGSPAVADNVISVAAGQWFANNFEGIADFSSRGPRRLDSALKPDITAPGYRIISAGQGSGNNGMSNSGTSMAAPHVAGGMALLRQLHPDWRVAELKALAMNTAFTPLRTNATISATAYSPMRVGAGQLDLLSAQKAQVVAYNAENPGLVSVSFGAPEVLTNAIQLKTIRVANKGAEVASYTATYAGVTTVPGVAFTLPTQVITIAAGGISNLPVQMTADAGQLRRAHDPTLAATQAGQVRQALNEASGYLFLWPNTGLFTATLLSSNVVPALASDWQGTASFRYTPLNQRLSYTIEVTGQSSQANEHAITSITLKRGPAGVNGPTLYTLAATSGSISETVPLTGVIPLAPSDEALLRAGELYVNLATLAQPNGALRGQLQSTEPVLAVPLYAAPRPAAAMQASQATLNFGQNLPTAQAIALQGVDLPGRQTPTETLSLVSPLELQWSSPNTPPAHLITDTEGSRVDLYDHADLKYVGVTSDFAATRTAANPAGVIAQSTLYFGLVTYGNWATPREVEFDIYLDTNQDGVADFMLFNTDQVGYNNENAMSDVFITALKDLHSGQITPQLFLNGSSPATLDTAPFNSNVMLLPIRADALGLTANQTSFTYYVESYSSDRPRGGDGVRRYVDCSPRLQYHVTQSSFDLTNGQLGAPLYPDLAGGKLPVQFDLVGYLAAKPQGILLLHNHNLTGVRAEVVAVHYTWPAALYLPLIRR